MRDVPDSPARFRRLRILAGAAAIAVGLGIVLITAAIGHCSAFGGRCPSEPVPLLEDDVFRITFMGSLLAIAAPVWLARPGWRRLGRALAIGVPGAVFVALLIRSAAG